MPNPYFITGPALISFSGGRTSAFMLHQIMQAHGGALPDDVVVAFANTGKEREETLRFVHECETRWGVRIRWLEFVSEKGPRALRFQEVGYNSAARNGEPLARLIAEKQFKPNAMMRFCTEDAKVNTIGFFCEEVLGWTAWSNVVGLRHDEGHRALKAYARNDEGKSPWRTLCPLDKARVAKADVIAFWATQPFDLGLRGVEGNCDLCFLKGVNHLKALIRQNPRSADWWIEQERVAKGRFLKDYSYADLAREVAQQPHFFDELDDEDHDAECGLICEPETT